MFEDYQFDRVVIDECAQSTGWSQISNVLNRQIVSKGVLKQIKSNKNNGCAHSFKLLAVLLICCRSCFFHFSLAVIFILSIEPASLVALAKGCSSLVLIGDYQQLTATILSREAHARGRELYIFIKSDQFITIESDRELGSMIIKCHPSCPTSCPILCSTFCSPVCPSGLSVSLLERLAHSAVSEIILLDVQRRMHPSIAEFPNFQVYQGKVRNAGENRVIQVLLGCHQSPNAHFLIFSNIFQIFCTPSDVNDQTRPPIPGFVFPNPAVRVCFVKVQQKKPGAPGLEASEGSSKFNMA